MRRSPNAAPRATRPCARPIPRELQAHDTSHTQKTPSEWNDGAGFECLRFAFSVPTYFQYRVDNEGPHFTATARGQKTVDGHLVDVTMVLRGEVNNDDVDIAPWLEETWRTVD